MLQSAGSVQVRSMLVSHWGSKLGLQVLQGLSRLYLSLVWESSVLIALCSDNVLPADSQFGAVDIMRVMSREDAKSPRPDGRDSLATSSGRSVDGDLDCLLARTACELGSDGVSAAMESLSTSETVSAASPMDMDLAGSSTASDKQSHLIAVVIVLRVQWSFYRNLILFLVYVVLLAKCVESIF